ncbi:MAG TPA: RHS repeat-associated core domain-containing protein [Bacteroidales bacterium]|nr:RHS repeat-associated core domain-containing protein [Bacteroidales bacterium]HPI86463.1 RHS repeat-associated core domain-containing protein [Bacteroidales bacterium]
METTDYYGSFVYTDDHLDYIQTSEGRLKWNAQDHAFNAEYFIRDHLGNIRSVITTDTNQHWLAQGTDYYPFGMEIPVYGNSDNQLKYNGKELQTEAGLEWYDYGARFYDPVIGRWHSVDPLAESSRRWSPYTYCMNNPIRFIDPDGMEIDNYSIDESGNIKFEKKTEDNYDMIYKKGDYDKNNLTDGYKVMDKNVLPNLTTTIGIEMMIPDGIPDAETGEQQYDNVTLNTACSNKQDEMIGLFNFAANASSNAEWRLNKMIGGEMELSTFHDNDESPNDSHLGINTSSVEWTVHSHPRTWPGGEMSSFGGDGAASTTYTSKNAGFYVYFPKSTYLYKFHPQNPSGSVTVSKTMTNGMIDTMKKTLK